jgi:hypothetical protein
MVSERASQRAFFGVSALLFAASAAVTRPCRAWARWRCAAAGRGRWHGCACPGGRGPAPRLRSSACGSDDDGDDAAVPDANAVALPPGRRQDRRDAPGSADRWWAWDTSSSGAYSEWPPFRWASRWRRSSCRCRRWRAPFRSWSVWSSWSPARSNSPRGRHITLPAAGRHRGRGRTLRADAGTAWRHGLSLGLHCSYSCADLTAILLVIGVMDLRDGCRGGSHHRRTPRTGR